MLYTYDDDDTDLGGVKADEHGGRPLKNSPRTLNQTVAATLDIILIIMMMAVRMMMMNIVMMMMMAAVMMV